MRRHPAQRRAGGDERVPDPRRSRASTTSGTTTGRALELRVDVPLAQRRQELVLPRGHLDVQRLGLARERRDLALVHDAALLEDEDAVARALDVAHDVRREQQADPELAVASSGSASSISSRPARSSPADGLVEEDEHRVVDERLRELHALPHARSSSRRSAGSAPRTARRGAACRRRATRACARGSPLTSAMWLRNSAAETFCGRQSCSGMYPRRARTATLVAAVSPSTSAVPSVGSISPRNSLIAVLLPAPFGPSSPVTASLDLEIDLVERDDLAVALRQPPGAEQHLHAGDTTFDRKRRLSPRRVAASRSRRPRPRRRHECARAVATYPFPGAFAAIQKQAEEAGAVSHSVAGNGIALLDRAHPENVHVAYPGVDYQVEAFDPTPEAAMQTVTSGQLTFSRARPARHDIDACDSHEHTAGCGLADRSEKPRHVGRPPDLLGPGRSPVTRTKSGTARTGSVFVRYLPQGVKVGAQESLLTVATYPYVNAFGAVQKLAKGGAKADTIKLAGGGLAVVDSAHRTSAHLAYPGLNIQIEVFDPSSARVRTVVAAQEIVPVS